MIKIAIHQDLVVVLNKINTTASRLLLSLSTTGTSSDNLDKDYANFINLSSSDRRKLSIISTTNILKYGEVTETDLSSDELLSNSKLFGSPGITSRRTCISPGKIFSKIFTKEYLVSQLSASDIELFSNKYVAEMESNLRFERVYGEDIRKYYNRVNYYEGFGSGSLFQSCMSNEGQQKFLDIYVNNPNVGLCIAFHLDGKIAGRALVWDNVESYDYDLGLKDTNMKLVTFMDRIYYPTDWIVEKFKDYAMSQGWHSRRKQSNDEEYNITNEKGSSSNRKLRIKIDNFNHQYYPYLDTLFHQSPKDGYLSNHIDLVQNKESGTQLRYTGGLSDKMWSHLDNIFLRKDGCVWIKNKFTYYDKTKTIKSSKIDDYFLQSECIFSGLDNEFIAPDDDITPCVVTGNIYRNIRMVKSEYHGGLIHKKESVNTSDVGLTHKTLASYSKTLKKWFTTSNCIKVESLDDFLPKEIFSTVPEKDFISFLEVMSKYSDTVVEQQISQDDVIIFEF